MPPILLSKDTFVRTIWHAHDNDADVLVVLLRFSGAWKLHTRLLYATGERQTTVFNVPEHCVDDVARISQDYVTDVGHAVRFDVNDDGEVALKLLRASPLFHWVPTLSLDGDEGERSVGQRNASKRDLS